jgi:DNA-binding phage protein
MPVEPPQVDIASGAARRTPRPEEPIAGCDGGADRRREQHGHPLGLALVPGSHQLLGIFEDLAICRTSRSRFLLGLLPAPVLHFALVETHGSGIMDQGNGRIEVGRKQMSRLVRVLDDKDVVERLHSSVKRAGGQTAFARQTGVDRAHLNHVLTGKRLPTFSILKALNLGIVYIALGQSAGLAVRKRPPRRRHG